MQAAEANPVSDVAVAIADAFTSHWRLFGLYPGATLTDEDGVLWYKSRIRHIPYNAVIRTRIVPDVDPAEVVGRVRGHFAKLDLPFMWVVLPTDRPVDYETHLRASGLQMVEEVTGMSLDFDGWQAGPHPPDVHIRVAETEDTLRDYEQMIRVYWSVPEESRDALRLLDRFWGPGQHNRGQRYVAYLDGKPVGKLLLNTTDMPRRVGVYGVATIPEARGHGIASALMRAALLYAQASGAAQAVLHASPMARPLYARLGFVDRCPILIYGNAPLYDTHHH